MQLRSILAAAGAVALAACSDVQPTSPTPMSSVAPNLSQAEQSVGGVFVSTNGAAGNAVVAYARAANGTLSYTGTFATGGTGIGGTNDPLVSQFALALSDNAKLLVVVNAGSNDVSSFAVDGGHLTLIDRAASGGVRPVSVSISQGIVYVLNSASNTIGVLTIDADGDLTALPAKTKALAAGASGAAQVRVSPNGQVLLVSERVSNRFEAFAVGKDGDLGEPVISASAGTTPFGFDFTTSGQPIVSEVGSSSASSYSVNADLTLSAVSTAAPTLQRAVCWLIVDASGRFAYTANAGSATITGFAIAASGELTRLTDSGVSADLGAGGNPLDLDMSRNGKFLYVFKNGTGTIGGFAVANDGSLTPMPDTPGLAARSGYMGLAAY